MSTIPSHPVTFTSIPLLNPSTQEKTVYLNVFSPINQVTASKFMAACIEVIQKHNPTVLYILLSSPGGDVNAGVTVYNYLRSLPVRLVMHNNGSIDSIANVIFHAADERHAAPHATFLFHGVSSNVKEQALNRSQMQELLNQMTALEAKISNILTERCRLTASEIERLFLNGETKDTAFALDKGIIQSIEQLNIPPNALVFSLNLA